VLIRALVTDINLRGKMTGWEVAKPPGRSTWNFLLFLWWRQRGWVGSEGV